LRCPLRSSNTHMSAAHKYDRSAGEGIDWCRNAARSHGWRWRALRLLTGHASARGAPQVRAGIGLVTASREVLRAFPPAHSTLAAAKRAKKTTLPTLACAHNSSPNGSLYSVPIGWSRGW
jgi:hypothetical protein